MFCTSPVLLVLGLSLGLPEVSHGEIAGRIVSSGYTGGPSPIEKVNSCTRAMDPMLLLGKYVAYCEYLCEGLPLRVAPEDNGTLCKVGPESVVGVCTDGACVESTDDSGSGGPDAPTAS